MVQRQIDRYEQSMHFRLNADDKTRVNARCSDCHDAHTFVKIPQGSPERDAFRLAVPATCGKCHDEHLEEYTTSIHGVTVLEKKDPKAATCADCHNPHGADNTSKDEVKLSISAHCANCHKGTCELLSRDLSRPGHHAGLRHTAKCFDCHGTHELSGSTIPRRRCIRTTGWRPASNATRARPPGSRPSSRTPTTHDCSAIPHVARLEIHVGAARRHVRVLLDAFGAVVLSRIQGSSGSTKRGRMSSTDALPRGRGRITSAGAARGGSHTFASPSAVMHAGADRHDAVLRRHAWARWS